ncbi:hypothetical protein [Sagittula stellata]|uniref:Uncharacterized protein n=1 Tax=Sagittula stellata (strain ATCC 700073 / DSM 11524 / E-37) TaxID=388399 RepID=A3KA38_SAGS3|nr:hypothetical protein [Sagittula stellata]EBA05981.1 hypothetical protein SSE37_25273 [Sagittula stellata E-37]
MTFCPNPIARRAAMLCNDARFQRFAAERSGFDGGQFTSQASAEFLRRWCRITSRRQLDTTPAAARQFDTLRTEFDAWNGRIARPD